MPEQPKFITPSFQTHNFPSSGPGLAELTKQDAAQHTIPPSSDFELFNLITDTRKKCAGHPDRAIVAQIEVPLLCLTVDQLTISHRRLQSKIEALEGGRADDRKRIAALEKIVNSLKHSERVAIQQGRL